LLDLRVDRGVKVRAMRAGGRDIFDEGNVRVHPAQRAVGEAIGIVDRLRVDRLDGRAVIKRDVAARFARISSGLARGRAGVRAVAATVNEGGNTGARADDEQVSAIEQWINS